MKTDNYRLQFITHHTDSYSYVDSAQVALDGGCRWIQLRMKSCDELLLERSALKVQQMCREYGATFIVDDNVALAKRICADGVHLGKNDMSITEARRLLGDSFIIGGTVNSLEDIRATLQSATPDYFGCGPFRFTSTKKNLASILGHEGYRNILRGMEEAGIHIPLVAIGGIRKEDIPELLACGVHGIALSGSILRAQNPVEEMKELSHILENFKM
jgi:thiamine-phosphate pyrophosphorylase